MPYGNLFAAFGAAPNLALGLLSFVYVIGSICVYASLIYQISIRVRNAPEDEAPARPFGLPEAILAGLLTLFLVLTINSAVSQPSIQFRARNLLANFLFTAFVVMVIVTLLPFRGFVLSSMSGFF